MAGTPGLDANFPCAAGRGCDGRSMVAKSRAASLLDGVPALKQAQSSLAQDLADRALTALDEAHEMAPGDERTEAMQRAMALRKAAEIQQLLESKRSAPAT